jgi:hypothetical protein
MTRTFDKAQLTRTALTCAHSRCLPVTLPTRRRGFGVLAPDLYPRHPLRFFRREAPRRRVAWSLHAMMILRIVVGFRRYYWLLLAGRHLTRRLFGATLCTVAALPSPSGQGTSQTGEDFDDERGTRRKGFEEIGRKSGSFRLWESRRGRTGSFGGRWRY